MRCKHAVDQLIGAHFEGKYADWHFCVYANLAGDIECERRLPDCGTRRNDDEVRFLESGEEIVEIRELCRNAAHRLVVFVELVDSVEGGFED